ncbi:MAG: hypothetical protein MI810_13265 [Flavobacteriales bacterium]|nr:hypothetical protein [Flavobacteriales bacterium]
MKNVIWLLTVGLMMVFTSCKKDYTCECVTTTETPNSSITATTNTAIKNTKKNATTICDDGDSSSSIDDVTTSVECEIK